jgi:hypothetical protein
LATDSTATTSGTNPNPTDASASAGEAGGEGASGDGDTASAGSAEEASAGEESFTSQGESEASDSAGEATVTGFEAETSVGTGDGDGDGEGDGDGDGGSIPDPVVEEEPCPFDGATRCSELGAVWICTPTAEGFGLWTFTEACDWEACFDPCVAGFARCKADWEMCGTLCLSAGDLLPSSCTLSDLDLTWPGWQTVTVDGLALEELPTNVCDGESGFYWPDLIEPTIELCGDACVAAQDAISIEVSEICVWPE